MDLKRLTEWLGTVEGFGKAAITLFTLIVLAVGSTTNAIDKAARAHGLSTWLAPVASGLVILAFVFLLWQSFRRFAQASRLEQPDAFTLRPTGPSSLIGRDEDLAGLAGCVKRYRVVLLDGESGCGKSALTTAGLAPELQQAGNLLPIIIRDWGEDWTRGPLSTALDALFHALPPEDRNRLEWSSAPDLAADTTELIAQLQAHLASVFAILGRRVLLIADQFDDYQARHRTRFLDGDGNWLAPGALVVANSFWALVRTGLCEGSLHLLVITRCDTAAGLSCVRFLSEEKTVTRTLPRVEAEFLRPLLAGIAPDDVARPVVSRPEEGWRELRDRIERDLRTEGAILMQQVRTILLGLRELPLLTPKQYYSAGGLRGVETLAISRAIRKAGDVAGGGEKGRRIARSVLGTLVLVGSENQSPKARRESISNLDIVTGSRRQTDAILHVLQREEVIRPAEALVGENAWQLDHDYLAQAVLAEARQADRWSLTLLERKAKFEGNIGGWRRQYANLLPVSTFLRLCWERARGRLKFGTAAKYVGFSALRHGINLMCLMSVLVTVYVWNQSRLLTIQADHLVGRFGGREGPSAVLETWNAPEPLRQRIFDLVTADEGRLERAVHDGWPLAHAAFEPSRIREAEAILRSRIVQQKDTAPEYVARSYTKIVARLNTADDIDRSANFLHNYISQHVYTNVTVEIVKAYTLALDRMSQARLQDEAEFFRNRPCRESSPGTCDSATSAYAAVLQRINDVRELSIAEKQLCDLLKQERFELNEKIYLAKACIVAAARLGAANARNAIAIARAELGKAANSEEVAKTFKDSYSQATVRLDERGFQAEVSDLRAIMFHEKDEYPLVYYSLLMTQATAPRLKAEFALLRERLQHEKDIGPDQRVVQAYLITLFFSLEHGALKEADLTSEAGFLRGLLTHQKDRSIAGDWIVATYGHVLTKMSDATELKTGIGLLESALKQKKNYEADDLAESLEILTARLKTEADLKKQVLTLHENLEKDIDETDIKRTLQAYRVLIGQLGPTALRDEAKTLRMQVMKYDVDEPAIRNLLSAHDSVLSRLNDAADINEAADFLRHLLSLEDLEQKRGARFYSNTPDYYADTVIRRENLSEVMEAARFLYDHVAKNAKPSDSDVSAYAKVVAAVIRREHDRRIQSEWIKEVLTLNGHPSIDDQTVLLQSLESASGIDFGENLGKAVGWATRTYGIAPEQLRPAGKSLEQPPEMPDTYSYQVLAPVVVRP